MATLVNINGHIFSKEKAVVSFFDHGFLFGDSVYEVLITKNGKLFSVEEHYQRLLKSASGISLNIPINREKFESEINKTITASKNKESYIRIIITRGQGEVNIDPSSCNNQNFFIMVSEFNGYPGEFYEKGVKITIVPVLRNHRKAINPGIKTGNYLNSVLAIIDAKKKGAYDGLMLNGDGNISECTTSNIYIVKNRKVRTPSVECGILKGVTRGMVLNLASENGIEIEEGNILPEDLFDADEAFVTSTTKGVMPVSECDTHKIGNGAIGLVTRQLIALYKNNIDKLTK